MAPLPVEPPLGAGQGRLPRYRARRDGRRIALGRRNVLERQPVLVGLEARAVEDQDARLLRAIESDETPAVDSPCRSSGWDRWRGAIEMVTGEAPRSNVMMPPFWTAV